MGARDVVEHSNRCLAAQQRRELVRRQRLEYGAQAVRRFRMLRAGIVLEAGGVAVKERRHLRLAALTVSASV